MTNDGSQERLVVGEIINTMTALIASEKLLVISFVLGMSGLGILIDTQTDGGFFNLGFSIANLAFSFFVTRAMVVRAGLVTKEGVGSFGDYFAVGFVSGLGIILGLILLIIPGVVLIIRWLPASAHILVQRGGVSETLGDSFNMTKGQFWPLFIAYLITLAPIALALGLLYLTAGSDGFALMSLSSFVVSTILLNLAPVVFSLLGIALGVAAYGLLTGGGLEHGRSETVSETFG